MTGAISLLQSNYIKLEVGAPTSGEWYAQVTFFYFRKVSPEWAVRGGLRQALLPQKLQANMVLGTGLELKTQL